jgi:thioredoxin 1
MSIIAIVLAVIVVIFAGLIILPRVLMGVKTSKLKGKPAPTPHKQSAKRIKSGAKTILYFFTPSCGACRMQEPLFQKIRKDYPDAIFKIDASISRDAASAYGVMGVPFLAFIEDGKLVSARAGVQSEEAILDFLTSGVKGA